MTVDVKLILMTLNLGYFDLEELAAGEIYALEAIEESLQDLGINWVRGDEPVNIDEAVLCAMDDAKMLVNCLDRYAIADADKKPLTVWMTAEETLNAIDETIELRYALEDPAWTAERLEKKLGGKLIMDRLGSCISLCSILLDLRTALRASDGK